VEHIRLASPRAGVDLVLDLVGASAWGLNAEVLLDAGRVIVVGLLGGSRVEVDLSVLLRKRLTLIGTMLRPRPLAEKVELTCQFRRRVLPLLETARVRPIVDRIFPLERAHEAHAYMFGKIVLALDGG
jgi:NADPH:quinone reductase-like Zn-dependent oxidoreductase